jgi:uncharacterized protein (TIGR02145 family)
MRTKLLKTAYCCCLLLLFAVGCKKEDESVATPPLAASTQTWTFGDQTWSDAIHCPECNKETFEDSYTDPQCRSYTESGKTWYYYNWAYVDANKATMCPSPWRVPTSEDFETLASSTDYSTLISEWGYGGLADGSSMYIVDTHARYWSSSVGGGNYPYSLNCWGGEMDVASVYNKSFGLQVRCVK